MRRVHILRQWGKRLPEPTKQVWRKIRTRFLSIGLASKAEFEQPSDERNASGEMSIIIPIHDAPAVLRRCLSSVGLYAPKAEVILVDDASQLEATKTIIHEFVSRHQWNLVTHARAEGHSRSCEAGVRMASRAYLCLLNSDTIVTPWSWRAAQEAFEADPTIGITGPTTSQATTLQMHKTAELCRNDWTDSQVFAFAERYISSQPARSWIDLPEIGGFAFFIRRALWDQMDSFAAHLPDYGNEFEMCRRAAKQGWRLVWTKNGYIHHLGQQSYGNNALLRKAPQ
jgi:GT2 family glycosyltransferase